MWRHDIPVLVCGADADMVCRISQLAQSVFPVGKCLDVSYGGTPDFFSFTQP
jgi:hypothetical protein